VCWSCLAWLGLDAKNGTTQKASSTFHKQWMNDGLQGTKLTQIIPYIPSVVSQTLTSKLFRALPAQVKLTQSDETTAWCSQILGSDKRAGDQLS